MAIEKVREYFKKMGIENRIMEFEVSSATVMEAAEAIGSESGEIAKSIGFLVDGKPVLIVARGDTKVNSGKFKKEFSQKPKMIPADLAEEYIGHQVGGVCPFAVKEDVKIYLDESLKKYEFVYPACGSSNNAIKCSIEELEKYSKHEKWVDVCKDME